VVSASIWCWVAVRRADKTDALPPLPIPAQPDPYEVAYLRAGMVAIERLAVLVLIESGHLSAQRQEASFWRLRPARTILKQVKPEEALPWYLSALLKRFATPQVWEELSDLWGDQRARLQAELEERLNKEQLLAVDEARRVGDTARRTALGICLPLGVLAVPSLNATLGSSISMLVFVFFTVCSLICTACHPGPLSKRGKAYLARLRQVYRETSSATVSPASTAAGASCALTFGFALFGAESLADTPYEFVGDTGGSGDSGDGGDGGDD